MGNHISLMIALLTVVALGLLESMVNVFTGNFTVESVTGDESLVSSFAVKYIETKRENQEIRFEIVGIHVKIELDVAFNRGFIEFLGKKVKMNVQYNVPFLTIEANLEEFGNIHAIILSSCVIRVIYVGKGQTITVQLHKSASLWDQLQFLITSRIIIVILVLVGIPCLLALCIKRIKETQKPHGKPEKVKAE